jgi:hypothetical protein
MVWFPGASILIYIFSSSLSRRSRRSRSDLAMPPTLIEPKRHVVHNLLADQRPDMVLTLVSRLCTGWSRTWSISLGLLGSTSNSKGVPMLSYISVYGRTPAKGDSACQG